MLLLSPENWNDYQLIDCGNFQKLERFGNYVTIRPEPQAIWTPLLSAKEWSQQAHVVFEQRSSAAGVWKKLKEMPDQWRIHYPLRTLSKSSGFTLRLGLTSFKHVGVFPEQAVNWDYIAQAVKGIKNEQPRFLNLFAYTGGASLAAAAAGAAVTHVDSIKQVITWANQNAELSNLQNIRWVVEDALKFVKREIKRGNTYHGIILDPPAYGHGPEGEKWKLEDQLNEMVNGVLKLLNPDQNFLILNTYSLGLSAMVVENLLSPFARKNLEVGELFLKAQTGVKLPLGVFGRFVKA